MNSEIVKPSPIKINSIEELKNISAILAQSGYFGNNASMAQCFTRILAGRELGIPAFAAITGIHVINGKPTLSANLMATLIKASGKYRYKKISHTESECVLEFFEFFQGQWESLGTTSFTMVDAKRAGLTSMNWQKFPKNMLFARAISNGFREFCPDLAMGAPVYTPEELGANTDENGDAIDAQIVDPIVASNKEPDPVYTSWKSSQDAILWAATELDITEEEASLLLERVEKDKNGKKMIPFYTTILDIKNGKK